ncbi:MAG: acyl-CoA dehydrogenase family protein [Alphaproteobacteria bacterium]|jgi:alkylation response protein AidB-like acyl-CoA dehydrogenase
MSAHVTFDYQPKPEVMETLRAEVRQFLSQEIAAGSFDPNDPSPRIGADRDFSRKLGARGWLGMTWPKQYGGAERSYLERYVVTEELLAARAPTRSHFVADRQSGPVILNHGSEALKADILPRIAKGELTFCIGMSEPDSGSDLFAAKAKAKPVGDGGWRLNGTKVWTSLAHISDYMIGIFRTTPVNPDDRRHGLSQFLVDLKAPGITINPIPFPTGEHEFNQVIFDDVDLPADHLLGDRDLAWRQASGELAFERSGPERFLETYFMVPALMRLAGPAPDASVAEGIGRLTASLHGFRQMSMTVAAMMEQGHDVAVQASLVKERGNDWEQRLPEIARHLAAGIDADFGARDGFTETLTKAVQIAPKLTIQGGTNEILRGIIARGLGLR